MRRAVRTHQRRLPSRTHPLPTVVLVSQEIATIKLPDLNSASLESAMRVCAGTARNMGITIDGFDMEESKMVLAKEKAAFFKMDEQEFMVRHGKPKDN